MRPIEIRQLRRVADLRQLNASNTAIALLTEDERKTFISEREAECSAIRGALWNIGQMKCWYSEAYLQEGEGHVEHYRPKKKLSGAVHNGYWWRAFDWTNLRLAHPTVNRRKTDYLTGKRAGKGSYFPLRDETARARNREEEVREEPVLLDPVILADTLLVCFDEGSGGPRPRVNKEKNEWLHRRADESIEYYHLDEASWNAKRADLMATVMKFCEQLETLPRGETEYNQKLEEIHHYINPYAEFSSACLQVVTERGLLEQVGTSPS